MYRKIHKSVIVGITLLVVALFLNPVLSQNSSDYKKLYNSANSMLVAGDFTEAIQLYNQAIQQNPKFAEAYLGLGIAYKETGAYQEAYDATLKVIKLKPNYYQAYYNLGIILEKLGRTEEAIDAYDKFLEEIPGAESFSDAKQRISKLKNINKS